MVNNNPAARPGAQPLWQNRLMAACYTVFSTLGRSLCAFCVHVFG